MQDHLVLHFILDPLTIKPVEVKADCHQNAGENHVRICGEFLAYLADPPNEQNTQSIFWNTGRLTKPLDREPFPEEA